MPTTSRGIQYPSPSDLARIQADLQALATTANTAIDSIVQSSSSAAGFTPEAGWDLDAYSFRRYGGVVQYSITVTRTGGTITVNSKGDITNTRVGSVIAGQRPAANVQVSAAGTGRGTFGGIRPNGNVDLASVAGSGNIVDGDQIQLSGMGILA